MTDATSPAYLPGFFQLAHGTVRDAPNILQAARDGDGLGWHAHNTDVHLGCERFFRTMYNGHLIGEWLPALDGVVDEWRLNWVWMPPWGPERITEDGRDQMRALGFNI